MVWFYFICLEWIDVKLLFFLKNYTFFSFICTKYVYCLYLTIIKKTIYIHTNQDNRCQI